MNSYAELCSKAKSIHISLFPKLALETYESSKTTGHGAMLLSFLLMMSQLNFLSKEIKRVFGKCQYH